jgi:hypothetical protein
MLAGFAARCWPKLHGACVLGLQPMLDPLEAAPRVGHAGFLQESLPVETSVAG